MEFQIYTTEYITLLFSRLHMHGEYIIIAVAIAYISYSVYKLSIRKMSDIKRERKEQAQAEAELIPSMPGGDKGGDDKKKKGSDKNMDDVRKGSDKNMDDVRKGSDKNMDGIKKEPSDTNTINYTDKLKIIKDIQSATHTSYSDYTTDAKAKTAERLFDHLKSVELKSKYIKHSGDKHLFIKYILGVLGIFLVIKGIPFTLEYLFAVPDHSFAVAEATNSRITTIRHAVDNYNKAKLSSSVGDNYTLKGTTYKSSEIATKLKACSDATPKDIRHANEELIQCLNKHTSVLENKNTTKK